jgi:hypothetical protein
VALIPRNTYKITQFKKTTRVKKQTKTEKGHMATKNKNKEKKTEEKGFFDKK